MTELLLCRFAVIGGGIAGVTCSETLSALCPKDKVLLITSSDLIKAVTNYQKLSKTLETFDVEERPTSAVEEECANVQVVRDAVTSLDPQKHKIYTAGGKTISYGKVCICTGGSPKVIGHSQHIIGIRDTESVKSFQQRLSQARRIVVVGNGGIATELVYEIEGCDVVWAVKDKSISSTFVDAGAAQFFLPHLNNTKTDVAGPIKRLKYTLQEESDCPESSNTLLGGALGPDWASSRPMVGQMETSHHIVVEYNVEVERVIDRSEVLDSQVQVVEPFGDLGTRPDDSWPVYVLLSNGKAYGCDFVVSATGVVPNSSPFLNTDLKFDITEDGGIKVNDKMETSVKDVYAAGDVCTASWEVSEHWLQMRLWSQARQMGCYAAKSMVASTKGEIITLDFCFELFAHVTKFFNFKVVLLGKFNGQGLGSDQELLVRVTKGEEYVKVILQDGRMKGAVLVGETDMEETFENLILNEMDLTPFKDHLLDSNIDIEDFFD